MLHQTGIGVLGPVFRAYDVRNDRLVAVKVFRLDLPPDHVVRLADALRRLAATSVPHPALASLFDVGIEGTSPFLVTAYLSGQTLDVWLRRRAPMAFDAAAPVLRALAEAIDTASDAGVRHGALHPRDVVISDDDRLAGVTGFGIVDALVSAGVANAVVRRPYMAPERSGDSWDIRADVYSLGVLAHEMFTGRRPAGGGEQDGVFVRELTPEQRVQLRKVLAQVLSDDPARRFDRAAAFVDALEDTSRRSGRMKIPRAASAPAITPAGPALADSEPVQEAGRTTEPDALEPSPCENSTASAAATSGFARDRQQEPALGPRLESEREFERHLDPERELEPDAGLATETEPQIVPAVGVAAVAESDAEPLWREAPADAVTLSASRDIGPLAADRDIVLDDAIMPASAPFVIAAARPPAATRTWRATGLFAAAGLAVGILGGALVARTWFTAGEPPSSLTDDPTAEVGPAGTTDDGLDVDADHDGIPPPPEAARAAADPAAAFRDRDAQPALARPGRLVVRSEPAGALVTIGGRLLGETPVVLRDLPLGTHDVRVAHPGHVPRTERVTLAASSPARTLSVTLQPGLAGLPGPRPAASARGAIDVDSRPRGARVLIDGRFVGHAPLRVADIGAGEHQITLELGGYHPATGRVQVEPGRAQPLRVTLRATQ